jgi:hypothetical protein
MLLWDFVAAFMVKKLITTPFPSQCKWPELVFLDLSLPCVDPDNTNDIMNISSLTEICQHWVPYLLQTTFTKCMNMFISYLCAVLYFLSHLVSFFKPYKDGRRMCLKIYISIYKTDGFERPFASQPVWRRMYALENYRRVSMKMFDSILWSAWKKPNLRMKKPSAILKSI